ncbi:hypothetical protein [Halomicrobium zhouii]|uniref:hypothetical protein n=1 Tax=Halomicrobium zhouii TaxID=767519 RepID=UPI001160C5B0|nr:hypothetical protein [Halomicrobium zhouii]
MTNDNPLSDFDIQANLSPDDPKDFVSHDIYLRRRYNEGMMKSIQKEIEGMVRLYAGLESKLDEESMRVVDNCFRNELDSLRCLEDRVMRLDIRKIVED